MLSNNLKTIGTKVLKSSPFLKKSSLKISVSPAARHFSVAFEAQNNASVHIQQTPINTFSAYTPKAPVLEPSNAGILSAISASVNNTEAQQVKEQTRQFSALSSELTDKLRAEFEVRYVQYYEIKDS